MTDLPSTRRAAAGFTLVEFILVMGLLAAVMAVAAPSLSRFFRNRSLAGEAGRLLALTEFARGEAVSQGMPAVVWVLPETGRYGMEIQTPWDDTGQSRRAYELHRDVAFDAEHLATLGTEAQEMIRFAADGYLEADSIAWIGLRSSDGQSLVMQVDSNRWAYEITTELRDDLAR